MTPLRILLRFQHLLHFEIQFVADDSRDASLFPDIAVDVNSSIPFVRQDLLEARSSPRPAVRSFDSTSIQAVINIDKWLSAGNANEDFPDDSGLRLIDDIVQRVIPFIAIGQVSICHHAVRGIIIQTAFDVFCHVFGVKLIDIHHRAGSKAACCGVVEIFFDVENADAKLLQLGFVDQSLQHITPHTVGFPCNHIAEFPFRRICHHALEIFPLIGTA